ncbi:matrix-remodeling-associated protein 5 [Echeneis naucrates]|uniref:Ig-like domain-containing protein n=1 Tax=Echeneis naucrates TaxID=173247 RepID=A0A665SZ12_ECHNA|nr:matrix-remodeling-associated protein 5 [Echeneis naucrates]
MRLQSLLLLAGLPLVAAVSCPRPCSCPQPAELHCTFRSLPAVPAAVSKHVERMNLGFNSINRITDKSLAGLKKLELLMIHGNDIHSLPDGAFRDLTSLQMLKMSYNKLKEISRDTLRGLWALGRLHLDHNRLEFIHPDAFQGLTSLRLLQLEGNRLQQLHPAAFATFTLADRFHVSTLRHLYLSDNGLTALPSGLVTSMPQLENLYLHGNPWTCDCSMRWLQDWDKTSPGVLKCKKDRALPGGQLCPLCSSPRHLQKKELQALENLVCSGPTISSPNRTSLPEDNQSDVMAVDSFREPFGNISLGLSDEHGNEVDLDCSIGDPKELTKISWEQVDHLRLASNATLSVDLECPVDREKYEQLWRLIAYYSNVPAHLQKGIMLSDAPHPTYVYKQDPEKDALYYTGVKANLMAWPAWLMQTSADLQLNRLQSSAKVVRLIMSTELTETVEVELARRQRRPWVFISSTNRTQKALSAVLGAQTQMSCDIRSSGQPVIHWVLPDGSKVEAPSGSPDSRVSAFADGQLLIKAVSHADKGVYYCVAKVHGDLDVLPLHLTVQESSSPLSGEDNSITPTEGVVGNAVSLPCTASGSPDPEINWILPSNSIVSPRVNSSRALVHSNGTLHIPHAQLTDSGFYKCIAINQHGVDAMATKVTVVRRKGLVRPLRKVIGRPQSASGVNTQIKVPTQDTEETSGDAEVAQEAPPVNQDPLRKRLPEGVAPGRRGNHPSRSMWRRPPVIRKPAGGRFEDRKNVVESRRRINMTKSKIDPEKWADILAKIRDRNAQNGATTPPVQHKTEETTRANEGSLTEGSSDGAAPQEREGQDYFTTPHTQMESNQDTAQGQGSQTTDNAHVTSSDRYAHATHATIEPNAMLTTYNAQHTTRDASLEPHTTSNGVFFLPQTTSVPLHAVTFWQANTNSASSGRPFSLQENHSGNTDVEAAQAADWSEASERSENAGRLKFPARSNNDSSSGSQTIPSADPNELETGPEENGKYLSETQPKDSTELDDLESQAMLTTASPTTTLPPPTTASWTKEELSTQLKPNSRRRNNGGRKKRPNRRKQKPSKPQQFTATTRGTAPPATDGPSASTQLKMQPPPATTAKFNTTVPFTESQAASSGRVSHSENAGSSHGNGSGAEPTSLPARTEDSLLHPAKPLFRSTAAPPSYPTASPGEGQGQTGSHTTLRMAEITFPHVPDMNTPSPQPRFTGSPPPPAPPSPETVQTDVVDNQSDYLSAPTENGGTVLSKEAGKPFLLPPSPSASTPSAVEHEIQTTPGLISSTVISQPSELPDDDLEAERVTTTTATQSEVYYRNTTISEPGVDHHLEETASVGVYVPIISTTITTPSSAMSSTEVSHVALPETSSTGTPFASTSQESPRNHSRAQQTEPTLTTLEPTRTSDNRPTTQPPPYTPTATPAPTVSVIQTPPIGERPAFPSTTQLPGQVSAPKIRKSSFQTFTVRAETDAQLPCEAQGEPRPFLSWTKVASGASIAQNTRAQRFEVHPNGTLIIRKTQHVDAGQYLCMVQNQYGTDKMAVNLVVLSKPPQVLQPQNRDVKVAVGGKVDLECQVEGYPTPRVTWVLPNQVHMFAAPLRAPFQQRVAVLSNGTLRISQVDYADRGIYKCIGSSAAGAVSVSVHLHVSVLPPVIQQTPHENATLPEGAAVYIHCTATGTPPPVIHWITPDGTQLDAGQLFPKRNLVAFPNGTLHIRALGPENTGRYECTATNSVASSRRTVFLTSRNNLLSSKANIVSSSPQRTDVIYGSKLLLNCVAAGKPDPWIIWRTPSKKLVDAQYSFDPRIKVFRNGTITINSVTVEDSGNYMCVARNKMGDDYVLLGANVLTKPAKIEKKKQRSSQEVVYGGDFKVDCVASGLPNPEISWALPDGTMVNPVKWKDRVGGGRSRRYLVFDNGTLYFNDVGVPEEGDYTCYAENQLGKDEMKVRVKVKVGASPPQIQDGDQNVVRVFYGETTTLRCHTKGEPLPVKTWISPTNKVISPELGKYQLLDDGTLVVEKAQRFDGGNYTCIARNSAGQDQKVIKLVVLVTPPIINGLRETASAVKVTAVQDQRKQVDCVAKGTPTPRVMWVLPGNVILPAPYYSNRMSVHLNGTLEIRSPRRTDTGQLICIARNEGGEVRLVVNLEVKVVAERPQISGPKTDSLSLTVGNAMVLNCSLEGSNLPHVTWILPNGTPLPSGTRLTKFFHQPGGSLIISNPSVGEAGMYRCLGRNAAGFVEHIITLSPGRKPEIHNKYNSPVSIMNGQTLLLHCVTNGKPLRLTWTLPSGVVLNTPQRAGRYSVLPNGTLAIQQVTVYDRGSYSCRAANEYGSVVLPVSVSVIAFPPQITNGPPSVTYAKRGVAVQLNCVASGAPRVEVAWETPDKTRLAVGAQPRVFGNKYVHPQGSLIIQNPTQRDAGVYRCTARNAVGVDSKATFLNVF